MIEAYKVFTAEKIRQISKEKDILDIGGGKRFQKWLKEYEYLFNDSNYKTFDYDQSSGADIVGDIHHIPLPDECVDAIICSSVLEHVYDPIAAVKEMHRILRKGGKIFLYVPSIYPYHASKGHYPDYWRLFDDTLLAMFKEWNNVELQKVGGYFKALSFFLPLQHRRRLFLNPLSAILDKIFSTEKRTTTSGYCLFAVK